MTPIAKYPGRPLVRGSHGNAVSALQRQLNELPGKRIKVDGHLGRETWAKADRFARTRHLGRLGATGIDAVIWSRIFGQEPPRLHPRNPETNADRLRRLRVEVLVRQRQLRELKPGKRRTAVERRYEDVRASIRAIVNPPHAEVSGNRVTGGTPRERLVLAAVTAAQLNARGVRHSFYSQTGMWTVRHGITGEPAGFRSDCSQFVTSMFWSAGLPDPNGQGYGGGFTGTLAAHCHEIHESRREAGTLVLYGPEPPYHHVELYIGTGVGLPAYLRRHLAQLGFTAETTIGHGSPPVDTGTVHMLADAHYYRAF